MEPACEQTNDSANCFEQAIAAIKLQSVSQLGASLSGLDPDLLLSVDHEGRSLLHWAVKAGNDDILEAFLEQANVYCQASRPSPQTVAPSKDDKLLELMLSPDLISSRSPMAMAICDSDAMKVYLLVRFRPWVIVWTPRKGESNAIGLASTMLKGSTKCRAREVLNAMLVGAIESATPLAPSFSRRLLCRGAAADTWAPSGLSALMSASSTNQTEVMALLISGVKDQQRSVAKRNLGAGADLQLADAHGRTALMHAAINDCADAVQLLLAHGAQVNAADLSTRKAVDHCKPGSEASKIISHHMHSLESKAEAMAIRLLQEEAESNTSSDGKIRRKKKNGGRKARNRVSSHPFVPNPELISKEGSTASPGFASFSNKMKDDDCNKVTQTNRSACTIGAEPIPLDELAHSHALAQPCGSDPFQLSPQPSDDTAGPWQTVETRIGRGRRWHLRQSHTHSSHSGQGEGSTREPQRQQPCENAMSTFKQYFYVRDCSAATQGPSSCAPDDPSSNSTRSDPQGVDRNEPPLQPCDSKLENFPALPPVKTRSGQGRSDDSACNHPLILGVDGGASSVETVSGQPRSPFKSAGGACRLAFQCDSCNTAAQTAPRHAGHGQHGRRHQDNYASHDESKLVADLAAQVVSLQQKLDVMASQHQNDMHEAIWETVQQMEARVTRGCARVAAQLTWHELHRTGLAPLYCGVVQGAVRPDALKAATAQCVAGMGKQLSSFACSHHSPPRGQPPPPPGPPPPQRCSPSPARPHPPSPMQPTFAPFLPPPPPGPPPQTPPHGQIHGARFNFHGNPSPQMSPLSHSHTVNQGNFSAHAKPFSPVACEWNGPSSIWAMNGPVSPACHSQGGALRAEWGASHISQSGCGVCMHSSDLQLPKSLPGSTQETGVK